MNAGPAREAIGSAWPRMSSGCLGPTAGEGAKANGMLTIWAQQVPFEPPSIVVELELARPIGHRTRNHGAFCPSRIDERSNSLMGYFARGFEPTQPAFDWIEIAAAGDAWLDP